MGLMAMISGGVKLKKVNRGAPDPRAKKEVVLAGQPMSMMEELQMKQAKRRAATQAPLLSPAVASTSEATPVATPISAVEAATDAEHGDPGGYDDAAATAGGTHVQDVSAAVTTAASTESAAAVQETGQAERLQHVETASPARSGSFASAEGWDEAEVEAIVGHQRGTDGSTGGSGPSAEYQYLVRWCGAGPEEDEWVERDELADAEDPAPAILQEYERVHGIGGGDAGSM
jgi:hypothetical protein